MVSIFKGPYKEKYNRCRHNDEGRLLTGEAFSYRRDLAQENLETFFIISSGGYIFERKPNTMQPRKKWD